MLSDLKEFGSGERAEGLTGLGWPHFSRTSLTSAPGSDCGAGGQRKGRYRSSASAAPDSRSRRKDGPRRWDDGSGCASAA